MQLPINDKLLKHWEILIFDYGKIKHKTDKGNNGNSNSNSNSNQELSPKTKKYNNLLKYIGLTKHYQNNS